MEKAELMQAKITLQRQLPNEITDKLNKIIFINLIISIALMIYVIIMNELYKNSFDVYFVYAAKISAIVFILLDVVIFEFAYRKENALLLVHGIEFFFISLFVLSIPYMFYYLDLKVVNIMMLTPVYLSIFYVGKSIVIYLIETNKYLNSLSDVNEILKDDNGEKSYIEEIEIDEKPKAEKK